MPLENCSTMSMGTYLGTKKLYIPNYQREYSWETDELDDFWRDLLSTDPKSGMDHFFGQVVIHDDNATKHKYIIDGQQRTITAVIFLKALQYYFEKVFNEYHDQDADYYRTDITSHYIGRYSSRKNELHLELGELDRDYFKDNIQVSTPDLFEHQKKKSQEHMRLAYKYFYEKLGDIYMNAVTGEDKLEALFNLYTVFTDHFMILYMEATQLDEAFTIFETLNARGKDLETADLLKNYIFSQSGNDIGKTQSDWNEMIRILDGDDTTRYIRYFWNSRHEFTREAALYRVISTSVTTPRSSLELLDGLKEMAQYYHAMTKPDDSTVFENEDLKNCLIALSTLGAKTFYPVVLAMEATKSFNENEITSVLQLIETFVFRNFTVCGNVANRAEIIFTTLAKNIYEHVLNSSEEINDNIRKYIVSDLEFEERFSIWQTKSKNEIRYTLRKIHNYLDINNEISINNNDVHIEHIMPENSSLWNISDDEHETYLWRIGNLALLSGRINIKISNKPFSDKKELYRESKIEPNQDLIQYQKWNPETIEDRQKKLAKYAVEIWKL
jgi:uncharacterized protein with ParB-like and HNH nuclease domain